MAAEKLRLCDQERAVCPADSPVCVMPTASNCQRLGSMRRMTMRESPTELGCFAVTYLRSMPGARLFPSEAGRASRSEERPRERAATNRVPGRLELENMARQSVAKSNLEIGNDSSLPFKTCGAACQADSEQAREVRRNDM